MKKIDSVYREKIQSHIKNNLDIADLIDGYDISGEDLTGAIISRLNLTGQEIRNVSFTRATIGVVGKEPTVRLDNAKITDCSFIRTQFPGLASGVGMSMKNCSFKGAFVPYFDYRYASFDNCVWCDTIFSIGTEKGKGARFSGNFFRELSKQWGIEIISKEK